MRPLVQEGGIAGLDIAEVRQQQVFQSRSRSRRHPYAQAFQPRLGLCQLGSSEQQQDRIAGMLHMSMLLNAALPKGVWTFVFCCDS
jgi:hypothetical protein